jgi:hypothetical protein
VKRTILLVAAIASAGLVALPIASAHVVVTANAPKTPIPADAPTSVPITFSANCAVVLAEYEAMGNTELQIIAKDPPAWLPAVGDKIPFEFSMCGTDANVRSTGNLVFTPGPLAPGLQPIQVIAMAEGESGEIAFNLTVAFLGLISIEPMAPVMVHNGTAAGELVLNITANAAGLLMFSTLAPAASGTFAGLPETQDMESPLLANTTSKIVRVPFTYTANDPANASADQVAIQVMLHAADDMSIAPEMAEITIMFEPMIHEEDHTAHEHDDPAFIPTVEPLVLLGAMGAAAVVLRRRSA